MRSAITNGRRCRSVGDAATALHAGTGTGIVPLSLYEPDDAIEPVASVHELASGRPELGVGLGWRDAEFDAFGLAKRERGRFSTTMEPRDGLSNQTIV
jgi:alkanesulfonate monooxygenase SsuD/methylene tetrahydromethanopterin reductase-like flavin-dependent oxidoreductase (luciferase family)